MHRNETGIRLASGVLPSNASPNRIEGLRRSLDAPDERQAERRPGPAPDTEANRAQSRVRTLASLEGTAQWRANVLAIGCPNCGTPAGRYCVDSERTGVRGFCGLRWNSVPGFSAPRPSAAPAAGAVVGRVNAHPNRHPMQHTRG